MFQSLLAGNHWKHSPTEKDLDFFAASERDSTCLEAKGFLRKKVTGKSCLEI